MIFQPVLHPLLLVLLCAPVLFIVIRELVRRSPGPGRPARQVTPPAGATPAPGAASPGATPAPGAAPMPPATPARSTPRSGPRWVWVLRLLIVLVVFTMLLRPGIPGGTSQTLAADTDIVLVVDTTASIVAEDWAGDQPRLDGIRADVQSIVDEYPGARFALITFDASAQLRLPLTTDSTAVISALEVLRPEVTDQSRGSSISIANRMLADTLSAAASSAPDRSRMVFYLGDGEQTVSSSPESFASSRQFVDGGDVFGYGTADGGPMRTTTGTDTPGDYIQYQGAPARSVVDEANLQTIAEQLGVDYVHRTADTTPALPEAPTSTTDYASAGEVGNVIELYWIFALALILLIGVELTRATVLVVRLRGLTAAGQHPAPAPTPNPGTAPASTQHPNFGENAVSRTIPPESSEFLPSVRISDAPAPTPPGGDR